MTPLRPNWWLAYCGAPYAFRGRDLATGIDCWGLFVLVQREAFGRIVDDFGEVYPPDRAEDPGDRRGLLAAASAIRDRLPAWRKVPWEEGAGALLLSRGRPLHVGVCTATRGIILHAHAATGVDLLDLKTSIKWGDKLVGCYLPPEA
jgi:cell wall-associated NlpC family hydrolase